jgi:hypothetical protein
MPTGTCFLLEEDDFLDSVGTLVEIERKMD